MNQRLSGILIVGLIIFGVVSQWRLGQAKAEAERFRTVADSIAADAAIDLIQRDSVWEARLAEETDRLGDMLAARDSATRRLRDQLEDANIRVGLLSEVVASARGELVSIGERLDSATTPVPAGTWGGDLADELLTGTWLFRLPEVEHTLDYSVTIPGELVVSETGDGRTLVLARATSERASLDIGRVFVDPPPPVVERKASLTQLLLAALGGAFAWELAR